MARPKKTGLDYFSHDTALDRSVVILEGKFGFTGYAVFFKLLEMIYKEKGYYDVVDEDFYLIFCQQNKIEAAELKVMIEFMVQKGIFDREIFEKHKVITSRRIQENYIFGSKGREAVKNNTAIKEEFDLIGFVKVRKSSTKPESKQVKAVDSVEAKQDSDVEIIAESVTDEKESTKIERIQHEVDQFFTEDSNRQLAIERARFAGDFKEEIRKMIDHFSSDNNFSQRPLDGLLARTSKWLTNSKKFNRETKKANNKLKVKGISYG